MEKQGAKVDCLSFGFLVGLFCIYHNGKEDKNDIAKYVYWSICS